MNVTGPSRGYKRLEKFCGMLLILAVCISLGEIIGRVFFHTTYDFIIDLPVWITVWAMLLVSGPLIAENGHVSIDFVVNRLKGRAKLFVELFNISVTIFYGMTVTLGGAALIRMLYARQAVFPKYFPIPKWIVELCVPLGMGIFTLIGIVEFYNIIKRYHGAKS